MSDKENDLRFACAPCRTCITNPFHCNGGEVKGVCLRMDAWLELCQHMDKTNKVLEMACDKIDDVTGGCCPYSCYNYQPTGENCDTDCQEGKVSQCWKEYFIHETK